MATKKRPSDFGAKLLAGGPPSIASLDPFIVDRVARVAPGAVRLLGTVLVTKKERFTAAVQGFTVRRSPSFSPLVRPESRWRSDGISRSHLQSLVPSTLHGL